MARLVSETDAIYLLTHVAKETPGEDPFHLQSYVNNLITGLQGGRDPAIKKVVATCKHFAGYDLENWEGNERYEFDAQITSQDLVD